MRKKRRMPRAMLGAREFLLACLHSPSRRQRFGKDRWVDRLQRLPSEQYEGCGFDAKPRSRRRWRIESSRNEGEMQTKDSAHPLEPRPSASAAASDLEELSRLRAMSAIDRMSLALALGRRCREVHSGAASSHPRST